MKVMAILLVAISLVFGSVDINNASKKELMSLHGVGSKKADAILSYRKGKCFKNVSDLTKVKGIGDTFISKNKKNLKVGKCKK